MFKNIKKLKPSSFLQLNNQKRFLNIHEFDSKKLMTKYGVRHQRGFVITDAKDAIPTAQRVQTEFGSKNFIVKSQILAGGRGKGVFNTGFKGGVKFCSKMEDTEKYSKEMLGNYLITKQTSKEGVKVQKVYIAECLDFDAEMYFAIVLDRAYQSPVMVACKEGGMDIEEVAEKNPDAIAKEPIDYKRGPSSEQLARLAEKLGFKGETKDDAMTLMNNLYKLFVETDATQIEVNPLVKLLDGKVACVDAKMNFDDNASFRQKEIFAMRDYDEEDPREVEASKWNLNYVGLDGNIGCMVNGAGLAMATMDVVKLYGGEPANFLDVGGGASTDQVREAFRILTSDPNVKCILVNIFGGIMRCNIIAEGIVQAAKSINLKIPLVVRLEGTNVDQGKKILAESGLTIVTASNLDEAAKKAVAALNKV